MHRAPIGALISAATAHPEQIGSIRRTDTGVFIASAGVWEVAHNK